jgi:hypothetical protein
MVIKLFLGGDIYRSGVRPGVYPKWSRVHLRTWCIEQLGQSVLRPLRTTIRSAPLMAWALRRLGATVGDNLQCDHDVEFSGPLDLLSIGDDVATRPEPISPCPGGWGRSCMSAPCTSRAAARSAWLRALPTM